MYRVLVSCCLVVSVACGHAQALSTPEDDERQAFGHLVQPGEEFDGVKTLLLQLFSLRYMLSGRLADASRVCTAVLRGSKMEGARKGALTCLAQVATRGGQFDEAEAHVLMAVDDAQRLPPGQEHELAASLKVLADLYESRGFLQLSERALIRAQRLLEDGPLASVAPALRTAPLRSSVVEENKKKFDAVIAKLNVIQAEVRTLLDASEHDSARIDELQALEKPLLGEMAKYKALFEESLIVGTKFDLYATVMETRWFVLQALGKEDEALSLARTLSAHLLAQGTSLENPAILLATSQFLRRLQQSQEAERYLRAALWFAKRNVGHPGGAPEPLPTTFNNPGAAALFGVPERSASISGSMALLGRVYVEYGNWPEARRFLLAALPGTAFSLGENSEEYAQLLYHLARVDLAEGKVQQGLEGLRTSLSIVAERQALGAMLPGGRTVQLVRAQHLVALGLIAAIETHRETHSIEGEEELLFEAFQSLRRAAAESAVAASSLREGQSTPEARRVVEDYLRAARRLLELRTGYAMLSERAASGPQSIPSDSREANQQRERATEIAQQKEIVKTLAMNLAKLEAEGAGRLLIGSTLQGLRTSLRADETLLQFAFGPDFSYVLATGKTEQRLVKLPMSRQQAGRLTRLLKERLRPPATSKDLQTFPLDAAFELYKGLFEPVLASVPASHRIVVVADGPLDGLPLGVLVTKESAIGTPLENYHRVPWLVESRLVTYVPSAATLVSLRARAPSRAGSEIVGIGGPNTELPPLPYRGVSGVVAVSLFPPTSSDAKHVRTGERELGQMQNVVQGRSTWLLGSKATKAALQQANLRQYRTLVFATHGYLANEMLELGEPSLLLTREPGKPGSEYLKTTDISLLHLDANLVLLNACNTAGGDGLPGSEGLSGLASAFFFAGARSLVASMWPVEQQTASKVGTTMISIANANRNVDSASALRQATLRALRNATGSRKHPTFWSPYVLVGDGAVSPFSTMSP